MQPDSDVLLTCEGAEIQEAKERRVPAVLFRRYSSWLLAAQLLALQALQVQQVLAHVAGHLALPLADVRVGCQGCLQTSTHVKVPSWE